MAVYMFGKLGATASFALVWTVTLELYPTNLRTQVRTAYFIRNIPMNLLELINQVGLGIESYLTQVPSI